MERFKSIRLVVIEHDGALVAIGRQKIGRHLSDKWRAPSTSLIPNPRTLNLNYIGSQVAKQHCAVRPSQGLGHFYNANTIQNIFHEGDYSRVGIRSIVDDRRVLKKCFNSARVILFRKKPTFALTFSQADASLRTIRSGARSAASKKVVSFIRYPHAGQ